MTTHVIGGGTVFHVRPHLALCAPAYGTVARQLHAMLREKGEDATLHLTRMGGDPRGPETNVEVAALVDRLVADPKTKRIFLAAALCDYEGAVEGEQSGKDAPRLKTAEGARVMELYPADKIVSRIRKTRKDVFLVAFKTTAGATPQAQYEAGLSLLKRSSANLVLANDVHLRRNMVIAPELARYHETTDREAALRGLVEMTLLRSELHFIRTSVVPGELVPWTSPEVPRTLRAVVEHCVARGAYKAFNHVTVGHFAWREGPTSLVSSRRKQNFSGSPLPGPLSGRDMVRVDVERERLVAHGAKPSAGTWSQWIVLSTFPDMDCIVHFHCPMRRGADVPVRSQREYECGSHECGENTRRGMKRFGELAAVMLDQHGPNVIFPRAIDPAVVIDFLEQRFDLTRRSGDD
jgi:hypothetical protein